MQHVETILPVLQHIQTRLDSDLSLEAVANVAGLSPYHFHRVFKEVVGETLKTYTQRLRLEHAAYQLRLHEASILDVALANGFHSHETFTRAFKKRFTKTPKGYRQGVIPPSSLKQHEPPVSVRDILNNYAGIYTLSAVRIVELKAIPEAFIRNVGPYEMVETSYFDTLRGWAVRTGRYHPDLAFMGVALDAPNITAPERLRFDVCLQVDGPIKQEGPIGFQELGGGTHAVASYVGPFGPTMAAAYVDMVMAISQMKRIEFVGLPSIEVYGTTTINIVHSLNRTEIYLPVHKYLV